jgi:hypothetical protein
MSEEPKHEQFINIEGPYCKSRFRRLLVWLLPSDPTEYQRELQKEIDNYWAHYKDLTDERAVVLAGSLCVEDCLNRMIDAFFPASGSLHDLSFSRKINLVRACTLIPSRILDDCGTVNTLRNAFAHNLELKNLSDSGEQKFQDIDKALKRYQEGYDFNVTHRKRLEDLVTFVYVALITYTTHVISLREYIDTEDFMKALKNFKESEH